jgi:hypothetical protein
MVAYNLPKSRSNDHGVFVPSLSLEADRQFDMVSAAFSSKIEEK